MMRRRGIPRMGHSRRIYSVLGRMENGKWEDGGWRTEDTRRIAVSKCWSREPNLRAREGNGNGNGTRWKWRRICIWNERNEELRKGC